MAKHSFHSADCAFSSHWSSRTVDSGHSSIFHVWDEVLLSSVLVQVSIYIIMKNNTISQFK